MICPSCQSDVVVAEKDYGALFNCPNCQSAYFINFDGAPEYSNEPAPELLFSKETVDSPIDLSEPMADVESSDFQEIIPSFAHPLSSTDSFLDPTFGESAFSNVASAISDFGNSETQITALNYDLNISGLDTREDLLAFKEMIEDSRFMWDVADLMKQIKGGVLFLPRLNPVQAYILAKRLHFLDLELKWKQNVLE